MELTTEQILAIIQNAMNYVNENPGSQIYSMSYNPNERYIGPFRLHVVDAANRSQFIKGDEKIDPEASKREADEAEFNRLKKELGI